MARISSSRNVVIFLLIALFSLYYFLPAMAQRIFDNQDIPSDEQLITLFDLIGVLRNESFISTAGVREQEIDIRFDAINFDAAKKLNLPLLDGLLYEAIRNDREGFERFATDEFTWRGKIYGNRNFSGDVVFSVKDKALSGLIYSPGAVYEIIPQENSNHLLVEIDQSRFPSCGGTISADQSPIESQSSPSSPEASSFLDDGSQIDVLIAYTARVRQTLLGTAGAEAFAQQAIASANTAYINSNITPRLRLVGTFEVNYNDVGSATRDAALWVQSDSMVEQKRNAYGADLVSIIIETSQGDCGSGFIMFSVSSSFESLAFSAVPRRCAIATWSFAHELGHNQGADHNPEQATPTPHAYPYAYGHYVDGGFRTVMSYENPCTQSGCRQRVGFFSNPSIVFPGTSDPTGITGQRDNHLVLNNTALTVSQFRDSVPTPTPTITPTGTPSCGPITNSFYGTCETPTDTPTYTPTSVPTDSPTPGPNIYPDTSVSLSSNTTIAPNPDLATTNITSMSVSTSTSFKGLLEGYPANGAVRVTNANPPGTFLVKVKFFNGSSQVDESMFMLTVTNGTACNGDPLFAIITPYQFPLDSGPASITIGDFNGDSIQDFAATNEGSGNVSIRLGNGSGGFTSPAVPEVMVGGGPGPIAIGDFNGDGKQDFATAGQFGKVSIRFGNGSGGFTAAPDVMVGKSSYFLNSIAIGDFNGDGKSDFATVYHTLPPDWDNGVSIRLGNGSGGFTTAPDVTLGDSADWSRSIAIGDFNGDSISDFAVSSSPRIAIRLGNGSGGFTAAPDVGSTANNSVAMGDFNGDGTQDLVTTYDAGGASVLLGNGSGGFTAPFPDFGVGFYPIVPAIGDLNGDGIQDIAVGNSHGDGTGVAIRLGNGSGGFIYPWPPRTGPPLSTSVAIGDFNRDGTQDFLAINNLVYAAEVFSGYCSVAPTATATNTPLATSTNTPTSTSTPAATPTSTGTPSISGTVTYGNAIGAPTPRFVSNVTITGAGSPTVMTTTNASGGTAGQYVLTGFGAGSYTVTPTKTGGSNSITSFDAARISQHVAGPPNPQLTGNQLVVADVSGNSIVSSFDAAMIAKFAAGPPYAPPGIGSTAAWRFLPVNRIYASVTSSIAGEDFSALLMGEVSGNWTNSGARPAAEPRDGKAQASEKQSFSANRTAEPWSGRDARVPTVPEQGVAVELLSFVGSVDKEIVVPVKVQGIADKGVISYEFDLRYDPSVMQPVGDVVDVKDTISRGLSVVTNAAEPGLLRVVVYGAYSIDGDGVLLNLRFSAVGGAGSISDLKFENLMFNEGEVLVRVVDGRIELANQ